MSEDVVVVALVGSAEGLSPFLADSGLLIAASWRSLGGYRKGNLTGSDPYFLLNWQNCSLGSFSRMRSK